MLDADPTALRGASLDALAGRIVAAEDVHARLRAGETIRCDDAPGLRVPVRASWVRLAAEAPGAPPPSALVLHDVSLGVALRRVEDVLLASVASDEPAANGPAPTRRGLLDEAAIARYTAREVRRSRRTGDPLSVALVSVPRAASAEHAGRCLARALRGADRVGRLHPHDHDQAAPPEAVTAVAFDLPLDPAYHWFFVVFPDTPSAGAHAAVMRLRSVLSGEAAVPGVTFGTATLDTAGPAAAANDCARALVARALAAWSEARAAPRRREHAGP